MNHKKIYPNYFWLLPFIVYTVIFILPGLLGFAFSFTNWTIYSSTKKFAGFESYMNLFSDSMFMTGFKNTILFTVFSTLFKIVIGFALALALNTGIRTQNTLRTVFYLPLVLSSLIVGIIFKSMLMPNIGLVNTFFGLFSGRLAANDWLGQPSTAMLWIVIVEIWKGAGYCMVIFIAGLQTISKDYYEASTIDGASGGQKFFHITLPMMMPTLNINVSLSVIGGLKVFDIIMALTKGGPGLSTEVLSTTVYKYLGNGALSTGSAANICLSVFVIVIFALINTSFARREVEL